MKGMRLTNLLKKIDQFGRPLPTFNLNGETEAQTVLGGVVTFAIIVIILLYGSLKLDHMSTKHNANVTSVLEPDVFDQNDAMNLNEIGFRLAFSVRGFYDKQLKDDPRYVKYLAKIEGIKDGESFDKRIPFHKCTDEDWNEFPPP